MERKSKFILQEYECAHSATRIIFYNKAWHGTRPSRMPFCRNFVRMPTQHLEFDLDFCLFWIRSLVHLVLFIQTLYMPFAFTFCWNLCSQMVDVTFAFAHTCGSSLDSNIFVYIVIFQWIAWLFPCHARLCMYISGSVAEGFSVFSKMLIQS